MLMASLESTPGPRNTCLFVLAKAVRKVLVQPESKQAENRAGYSIQHATNMKVLELVWQDPLHQMM